MKNPILDYLKDDNFENEEFDIEKKNLIKLIKEINLQLAMSGFQEIGDIFDGNFHTLSHTISIIYALVNDRQKILETKAELNQKYTKLEIENLSLLDKMENSKDKVNEQINIINSFKNKIKSIEIKHNEEIEKIKGERDDYLKSFNRIIQKENQYKHEIKKLEKDIENTKVKMNKILSEKKPKSDNNLNISILNNSVIGTKSMNNTFVSSNNIVLSDNLKDNILNSNTSSQKEFYTLINKAFNDKINLLLNENDQIKECLKIIYNEIYQYIDFKKLVLLKFTKDVISQAEFREVSEQLNNKSILRQEIFNMNFEDVREQIYNSFNDTLMIFRKYLVYDILKVDPKQEFDFDPNTNILKNNKFDYNSIPYFNELKNTFENKKRELIEMNKLDDNFLTNYNLTKYEENLNPFSFVYTDAKNVNCHEKIDNLIDKMKSLHKKLNDCDSYINNLDLKIVKINSEDEIKKKSIEDYNTFSHKMREKCLKLMENFDN